MTENFLFKAVFISLAAHTAILCLTYFNKVNDRQYKAALEHRVEISYKPAFKRPADIREHPVRPAQHLDFTNNPRLFSDGSVPVSLVKDEPTLPFGMLDDRRPDPMQSMEINHRVSIMQIKSEKINNPVYAAYNEMVRDRIKERVYENFDRMEKGSVYLTFLLNDHGVLEAAKIIPDKTDASEHLQEIAMRSLREASPFPPFLRGMNLSEYPFNIEIDYQVSDD